MENMTLNMVEKSKGILSSRQDYAVISSHYSGNFLSVKVLDVALEI